MNRKDYQRAWRIARQKIAINTAMNEIPAGSYAWIVLEKKFHDLCKYESIEKTEFENKVFHHLIYRNNHSKPAMFNTNLNRIINSRLPGHFYREAKRRQRSRELFPPVNFFTNNQEKNRNA